MMLFVQQDLTYGGWLPCSRSNSDWVKPRKRLSRECWSLLRLESPAWRVSPLSSTPKPATGQSRGIKVYLFPSRPSSLTFSLHHREKQAQGPEETTIQLLLLFFQFF